MKEEKKIFERNPDTGEIRSRKPGDYGNEKIEKKGSLNMNWNWRSQMKSLILFLESGDEGNRQFAREELMNLADKIDEFNKNQE